MMTNFYEAFGTDNEDNKLNKLIEQANREKWCCTCESYIPVDEKLPGFVTAFAKCEYGGIAEDTCEKYRRIGTGIRSSTWADGIRKRFMMIN
jgi:hypothetical protein